MARRKGSDAGNLKGGELDPDDNIYRRCKNSPSILSYRDQMTKESCDRGNKLNSFTLIALPFIYFCFRLGLIRLLIFQKLL